MIEADFEGGSLDNLEDAVVQLDNAGRPYILFVLSTMSDGRVLTHLTPNSKQLFRELYENGMLNEMLEDALYDKD
jgi:hypothetical protein